MNNKTIKFAVLFFVFSFLLALAASFLVKPYLPILSTAGDFVGGIFGFSASITNLYLFYKLTVEISAYQNKAQEDNRTYMYKSFLFESRSKLLNEIILKTNQLNGFTLHKGIDNLERIHNFQKELSYLDVAVQKMFSGITIELLISQIDFLKEVIDNVEGHTQNEIDIVMLGYSQVQYETISQLTVITYEQFPPT